MKTKISVKPDYPENMPDLFTMPDGTVFSSQWLTYSIFQGFKAPLDPSQLEWKVVCYVLDCLTKAEDC